MEAQIKASKTDPFCQGIMVHLGATQRTLCPMETILSFLELASDTSFCFCSSHHIRSQEETDIQLPRTRRHRSDSCFSVEPVLGSSGW